MKPIDERVAVCETEITHLKDVVKRVCENDLPHIYDKLDAITSSLASLRRDIKDIHNQEKLGKKEKAAIVVAVITAAASIVVAYIGL